MVSEIRVAIGKNALAQGFSSVAIGESASATHPRAAETPNRYWGAITPPKSKSEFFNAVTTPAPSGDGTVATIRMYGPIDSWGGWWGISAEDFGKVLDALPSTVEQIVLRINSPGGEVWEGMAILNMLRAHKAKVTAVVDAIAASAASVVAAGCDETVMSPGTQMMIHSPSAFAMGNAVEMRKVADILDTIEASLVEIYTAKAGAKDWEQLLADETWMTATEAVALGLADRVDVVPDAGETSTVGEEPPVVVVPDPTEDPENVIPIRFAASGELARRFAALTPVSTEPGNPNRKDEAMAYGDLQAGLRDRLGVTDADASDETLLSALDQALAEQADETPTALAVVEPLPEGVVVVDSTVLADLRAQAAQGAEARAQQATERRGGILASALADGRITPASRDHFAQLLASNEAQTTQLLESMPKNTALPVVELGNQIVASDDDDANYEAIYGKKEA